MATPRNRLIQIPDGLIPGGRIFHWRQEGWDGDRVTTYSYDCIKERVSGHLFHENGSIDGLYAGNAPGQFRLPAYKMQSAYNTAYSVFTARAKGNTSSMGTVLGEYKQAASMARGAATRLVKFTEKLKKKFEGSRRIQRMFRSFADYWLEYSFGWAPLFSDLYKATQLLGNKPSGEKASGRGSSFWEQEYLYPDHHPELRYALLYKVRCFGTVSITNPSAALLEDLGLANPALVAWELMPWSFVADWMFDVSTFLGSFTDFLGRTLQNDGVSESQFGTLHMIAKRPGWTGQSKCTTLVSRRRGGIPFPLPNVDIPKNVGSNLKRAANALALTVQIVTRKGR